MIRMLLLLALAVASGVLAKLLAAGVKRMERPKKTPPPEGFTDIEDAEFTEIK